MTCSCPHCNQKYTIDNSFIGKTIECQTCQNEFVIVPEIVGQAKCTKCKGYFDVAEFNNSTIKCPLCNKRTIIMSPQQQAEFDKKQKVENAKAWTGCSFMVLILIAIVWGISSCVSSCNENSKQQRIEQAKNGDISIARIFCEDKITERLRAPSTAKFSFTTQDKQDNEYNFSGFVDSQNGFGAMVRTAFKVRIRYVSYGTYVIESLELR